MNARQGVNRESLEAIERAVLFVSLEDTNPPDVNARARPHDGQRRQPLVRAAPVPTRRHTRVRTQTCEGIYGRVCRCLKCFTASISIP